MNLRNNIQIKFGCELLINKYWDGEYTISYEEFVAYDPSWGISPDEVDDPDNWDGRKILSFHNKALGERALNCSSFEQLQALIKKELAVDLLKEAHLQHKAHSNRVNL